MANQKMSEFTEKTTLEDGDFIGGYSEGSPNSNKKFPASIFSDFVPSLESGIVAAGTVQGDATELTKTRNRVDTVPPGTGVVEDASAPATRTVQNNCGTGVDLLWYPNGTDEFYITGEDGGGQGAGVPITIADGNSAAYIRYDSGILTLQG